MSIPESTGGFRFPSSRTQWGRRGVRPNLAPPSWTAAFLSGVGSVINLAGRRKRFRSGKGTVPGLQDDIRNLNSDFEATGQDLTKAAAKRPRE